MRNVIVATLLVLPAIALARDPKMAKPEARGEAAKAMAAKAEEAKGMSAKAKWVAERKKEMAEEAHAGAEQKKAEHGEHGHAEHGHAEHGEIPAVADPSGTAPTRPGMVRATMSGHGRPAADVARAIVSARGDVARARAEARRGEKERVNAHMRRHAGHAGHEMPMPALREELRRHARRLARLARVRELADTAKDADTVTRADKLIDREQERHARWMGKHAGAGEAPTAPAAAPQGGTP